MSEIAEMSEVARPTLAGLNRRATRVQNAKPSRAVSPAVPIRKIEFCSTFSPMRACLAIYLPAAPRPRLPDTRR